MSECFCLARTAPNSSTEVAHFPIPPSLLDTKSPDDSRELQNPGHSGDTAAWQNLDHHLRMGSGFMIFPGCACDELKLLVVLLDVPAEKRLKGHFFAWKLNRCFWQSWRHFPAEEHLAFGAGQRSGMAKGLACGFWNGEGWDQLQTLNFGCDAIAKNSVGQLASGQINGMPPRIDALARGGQWEASLCILQVMFEETFIKANLSPQNWPINAGWWTLISEGYQFWNIPNLSQSDTEIWFQRYVFRVCQWPVTSIDYVNPYCNAGEHQAQSHFLQFCDKCLCQRRSLVGGTGASGENEEGQMPQSEPRTKRPDANDRMHFVSDNETHGSNSTALTHFNPMCSSFWCANVDTLYDRFMFHHSTHQFWTTEIHWSIQIFVQQSSPTEFMSQGLVRT